MNTKNLVALKSRSVIALSGLALALIAPTAAFAQSVPNNQNTNTNVNGRGATTNRSNANAVRNATVDNSSSINNSNAQRANSSAQLNIDPILLRVGDMLQVSRTRANSNSSAMVRQPYSAAQDAFNQLLMTVGSRPNSTNAGRSFIAVSSAQVASDIRILRLAAQNATANRQVSRADKLNRAATLYARGVQNFFMAELHDAMSDSNLRNDRVTAFTIRHVPNQSFPNASFQNGDGNLPNNPNIGAPVYGTYGNYGNDVYYSNGAIISQPGVNLLPSTNTTTIGVGGGVSVGTVGTNPNPNIIVPPVSNVPAPPISNGNPPASNPATPNP